MNSRGTDSRSSEEWAAVAEAAAKKLAAAPPRSLRAVVEMNLPAIELRLERGWSIAQVVQELNEAGIRTTVAVFKNTLYRLRQKARKQRTGGLQVVAGAQPLRGPSSDIETGPTRTPVFKAKADTKNHF